SDHTFIETHDPNELFPVMGKTLRDVVPGCLSDHFLEGLNRSPTGVASVGPTPYFVHFESGKRIYQLYAELDVGDRDVPGSLAVLMKSRFDNDAFLGSWGFATLGGAGGQTVVGALSTGTHGGDFERAPIADAVVALHLVLDGGKHVWVERGDGERPFMTDRDKLIEHFGQARFGGPKNFEVIYSTEVLNAALIQVGRYGTIYSAVIRVVPQYGLREELLRDTWENVRGRIADPGSDLFIKPFAPAGGGSIPQRFLQIAINPIAGTNGTTHTCGITRRWTMPLSAVPTAILPAVTWPSEGNPAGRPERVGNIAALFDPKLKGPRFTAAGKLVGFTPDDSGIASFNLFDAACADANFVTGIIEGVFHEIEDFVNDHAVAIGGAIAGAVATGLAGPLLALLPALLAILAFLAALLALLEASGQSRLGEVLDDLRAGLLDSPDPVTRAAGILIWRAIAGKVFDSQQAEQTYAAISYAVMDTHNYADLSCNVNVKSVEVFFAADDLNLIAFVDRLLQFEIDQEFLFGHTVVGYVSLRFCGQTHALIGQEKFARTVAVECSGLADVNGSTQFVDFAMQLALDPNINGILHWGQQNASSQAAIEFRFGDRVGAPTGPLHTWRGVLAQLTDNGRLDGFSSQFTRHAGLEVVQPRVRDFAVTTAPTPTHHACSVSWDCAHNPPGTTVRLEVHPPSGNIPTATGLPLTGSHQVARTVAGTYQLTLIARFNANGETREDAQTLAVVFP
ncbi:MAG TPA: hypothetical protein VK601_05065, partial [Kofleriaceae bacterium]|nr:hypothetical protein [Kofleriaceae bacterium]